MNLGSGLDFYQALIRCHCRASAPPSINLSFAIGFGFTYEFAGVGCLLDIVQARTLSKRKPCEARRPEAFQNKEQNRAPTLSHEGPLYSPYRFKHPPHLLLLSERLSVPKGSLQTHLDLRGYFLLRPQHEEPTIPKPNMNHTDLGMF